MISELELSAARAAWKAFKLPMRANHPPERMDDGVGYLQLSDEPITSPVRRAMLLKAGNEFARMLPEDLFEVTALSFGLCWERMK
jgi:hypothetical protein